MKIVIQMTDEDPDHNFTTDLKIELNDNDTLVALAKAFHMFLSSTHGYVNGVTIHTESDNDITHRWN